MDITDGLLQGDLNMFTNRGVFVSYIPTEVELPPVITCRRGNPNEDVDYNYRVAGISKLRYPDGNDYQIDIDRIGSYIVGNPQAPGAICAVFPDDQNTFVFSSGLSGCGFVVLRRGSNYTVVHAGADDSSAEEFDSSYILNDIYNVVAKADGIGLIDPHSGNKLSVDALAQNLNQLGYSGVVFIFSDTPIKKQYGNICVVSYESPGVAFVSINGQKCQFIGMEADGPRTGFYTAI